MLFRRISVQAARAAANAANVVSSSSSSATTTMMFKAIAGKNTVGGGAPMLNKVFSRTMAMSAVELSTLL